MQFKWKRGKSYKNWTQYEKQTLCPYTVHLHRIRCQSPSGTNSSQISQHCYHTQFTGCAHWGGGDFIQPINKSEVKISPDRNICLDLDILHSTHHDIMAMTAIDHASPGLKYNKLKPTVLSWLKRICCLVYFGIELIIGGLKIMFSQEDLLFSSQLILTCGRCL